MVVVDSDINRMVINRIDTVIIGKRETHQKLSVTDVIR